MNKIKFARLAAKNFKKEDFEKVPLILRFFLLINKVSSTFHFHLKNS